MQNRHFEVKLSKKEQNEKNLCKKEHIELFFDPK